MRLYNTFMQSSQKLVPSLFFSPGYYLRTPKTALESWLVIFISTFHITICTTDENEFEVYFFDDYPILFYPWDTFKFIYYDCLLQEAKQEALDFSIMEYSITWVI